MKNRFSVKNTSRVSSSARKQSGVAGSLKIGFVLDDGLDKPDGVQQYILTLGEWLSANGHSVRYLVGETNRSDIPGLRVMSRNLKVKFNGNDLSMPLISSAKRIKKVLADEKFDVLHVQMPYSPFMAARIVARASKKTRIIGTFHVLPFGTIPKIGAYILGWWLRLNLRYFDYFVSVSAPTQKYARKTFGIDSEVLPNAIDIKKFRTKFTGQRTKVNSKKVKIVFLGRLVKRKGCRQLLQAISYLNTNKLSGKPYKVEICGDGPERRKLENYVKETGLSSHVTFHGFIDEESKSGYLSQADIAVFPALGGESFGIVLLEAMAAGAGAVIAGDNPGYSSVLAETPGCLFNPSHPEALAKLLADLINNTAKIKSIHKKQHKLLQQFDINIVGNRLLNIYNGHKDGEK